MAFTSYDILLDDDGDLLLDGNDEPVVGLADSQHIQTMLQVSPGHLKLLPATGKNLVVVINGSIEKRDLHEIKKQLESDGFKVKSINYSNNNLEIDATR